MVHFWSAIHFPVNPYYASSTSILDDKLFLQIYLSLIQAYVLRIYAFYLETIQLTELALQWLEYMYV